MKASSTRGLTLIELVIAMSIFALVAIMGVQSLTGALRLRDRLAATVEETSDLGRATALLRNDLSAAVPMLFYPPDAPRADASLDIAAKGMGIALSVGGQAGLSLAPGRPAASARQRVEWWLDPAEGLLFRRAWSSLYPDSPSDVSPDVAMLEHVEAIELRTYWPGYGWVVGLRPEGMPDPGAFESAVDSDTGALTRSILTDMLPLALDVTLVIGDLGEVTITEVLR
ncbi:prepilin-type N-terminal cleavage/methylation domain-containing protein [Roseovarius aestuariivivens]|uniref:prepilin-type N-terminal cleavage/methylation domain-containing protein n=1 Tax=Roseovarius aestuariivivens TaxID=1888910 RepID=UPI00108204E9|nr:prepilin-type N-terminal cleavage/methylation domain-containing protein [Roseovarius aestuariivivens]